MESMLLLLVLLLFLFKFIRKVTSYEYVTNVTDNDNYVHEVSKNVEPKREQPRNTLFCVLWDILKTFDLLLVGYRRGCSRYLIGVFGDMRISFYGFNSPWRS